MNGSDRKIQASFTVSALITVAMMTSIGIYVFIAFLLVGRGQVFPVPGGGALRTALVAAAILSAAGGVAFFRTRLATLAGGAPNVRPEEALSSLLTARIVGLALAETSAIMGLVLTLTTGAMSWSYTLSGLALAVMVLLFPSRQQLKRVALPEEARSIEPT